MGKNMKFKKVKRNKETKYDPVKDWDIERATGTQYQEIMQDRDMEFSSMIGDFVVEWTEEFDTDDEILGYFKKIIGQNKELAEVLHYTDSATDILEIDDMVHEYFDFDASDDFFKSVRQKLVATHVIMSSEGDYLGVSYTIKDEFRNMLCALNSIYGIAVIYNERGFTIAPYRNDKLMDMAYSSFKELYKVLKAQGHINPPGISRYCS